MRRARTQHPSIHAEATPHHFSLTEDAILTRGTLAKVNPPLRTERDRMAIIRGLQDGTIDIIATDHAPHSAEEKARPFVEAPSGMIGLETALSLAIRNLVNPGHLTMMISITSTQAVSSPARRPTSRSSIPTRSGSSRRNSPPDQLIRLSSA